jgi:hypothetical protein
LQMQQQASTSSETELAPSKRRYVGIVWIHVLLLCKSFLRVSIVLY